MPVRKMAVIGAVLAHGRDHEAILQRHAADLEGLEQCRRSGRVQSRAGWGVLNGCVEGHARSGLVLGRHDFASVFWIFFNL